MNEHIEVWRDTYSHYEHVGSIISSDDHPRFSYDTGYAGPAISVRLPIQSEPFSERDTEIFFAALSPEGQTRIDFLDALRASRNEYAPLIQRLNEESSGGLVFSSQGTVPGLHESYEQLNDDFFGRFARSPQGTAEETVGQTRLSLAGAMAKVGLYQDPSSGKWLLPHGSAPSTHIVKAGDSGRFPLEILNEALCLETARLCDLPVEEFSLLRTDDGLLLAAKRFDRILPEAPGTVDGHPRPLRLHQEDLCQVCGTKLKYEPSDAHYLRFAASHVGAACANGFGEAMMVLYSVFFSYLMGNCDNHLKNLSLLYSPDWRTREVSPFYDIIDTTLYASLDDVMGIGLSPSRSIFGLTREDVRSAIDNAGMPVNIALREFDALCEEVRAKFPLACANIGGQGFGEVEQLEPLMGRGIDLRASFRFTPDSRQALT